MGRKPGSEVNNITKNRKWRKWNSSDYRAYVLIFLLLLPIYSLAKTLLDIHILLNTGRLVGTEDWIASGFSQREQTAEALSPGEKRVLIIAGSNGLFGLSAKTISEKTGITAINLSSHAGLGGDYILNRAQKILRKNDIVLLPLEYQFYTQSGLSSEFEKRDTLRRFLISYDRATLQKVSIPALLKFYLSNTVEWQNKEYIYYLSGHLTRADITKRLQEQRDNPTFNCFSGLTFNEYGDENCNNGRDNLPVNPLVLKTAMSPSNRKLDPGGYIDHFVRSALQKGVKIIPLYPVSTYTSDYEKPEFKLYAERIRSFWESKGVPFEDRLENSLLPASQMYNTYYHPRDNGRQKRTDSIINLIKKHSF